MLGLLYRSVTLTLVKWPTSLERFCISGIEVTLCFIRRETESTSIAKHWPTSRACRDGRNACFKCSGRNSPQGWRKQGDSRVMNTEVLLRIQSEDTYRWFRNDCSCKTLKYNIPL